jgi:hypothetical protein
MGSIVLNIAAISTPSPAKISVRRTFERFFFLFVDYHDDKQDIGVPTSTQGYISLPLLYLRVPSRREKVK